MLKSILFGSMLLALTSTMTYAGTDECTALDVAINEAQTAVKQFNGRFHLFDGDDAVKMVKAWNDNQKADVVAEAVGVAMSLDFPNAAVFFVHDGKTCNMMSMTKQDLAAWLKDSLNQGSPS